ncbi:protein NRT1/ PTR FAMILY 8.1 [Trifolium repens]|jgi:hypothetical protein|nr:protein NRT1/ PTR FAMILY 8.1 [Trifolium repens]
MKQQMGQKVSVVVLCVLSEVGIGSWLSTALVKIVIAATGGQQKGWLRSNNLNYSRLDWFYWILTCLNAINFLVYLLVAKSYKGKESHLFNECILVVASILSNRWC